MQFKINYLYPFDLGMELDWPAQEKRYAKEILRRSSAGEIIFDGKTWGEASWTASIYPFGIGMIELSLSCDGELGEASSLAIHEERVHVGKYTLPVFFRNNRECVSEKAKTFARLISTPALDVEEEIFALFELTSSSHDFNAENFLKRNSKSLFAIVTGEASSDILSQYAMEKEALKNIGYYESEVILLKRFGAFIHSKEAETIKNLTALGLAQYFNIKTSNAFLLAALNHAQAVIERQPPYSQFWRIPAAYQRLSSAQGAFSKSKISIVESLHTASAAVPQIDSDWHLKSVHREILDAFNLEEQAKIAMLRLDTIDSVYANLSEHLSTVFFIFLDFVFLTWLLVDLCGWILLLTRTKPL